MNQIAQQILQILQKQMHQHYCLRLHLLHFYLHEP